MDILSSPSGVALCLSFALVLGGALGAWTVNRIVRRGERGRERSLARRELALLDARREGTGPALQPDGSRALDENVLLDITVRQLDEACGRADALHAALDAQERHHARAVADLGLTSVRARKLAHRALTVLAAYRTQVDRAGRASPDRRTGHAPVSHARHERRTGTGERRTAGSDRRVPHPPPRDTLPLRPARLDAPAGNSLQTPPVPVETAGHARVRSG